MPHPRPNQAPADHPPTRVVSLVPSATEIVHVLGAGDRLVARSHECDFPSGVFDTPAVTSQFIHSNVPSEIDRQVREALAAGTPLYRLDADALARLEPDLIITQDLCSVCSIDMKTVRQVAAELPDPPTVLSLNPTTIEDVLDDILRVGAALGLADRAMSVVVTLRERLFSAADFVNPYADGPSVAFLEWTDPLFAAGHWTPQLIERAGGRHPLNPTQAAPGTGTAIGPQAGERRAGPSIRVTAEQLIESRPEAIVICPCGVGLPDARNAATTLLTQPWASQLPAVRAGRVAIVDGNQMFNRPGPRLIDAFEWLVSWLNSRPALTPASFPWERWEAS